eukprot:19348-Heterococcus_DN1.PRE.2
MKYLLQFSVTHEDFRLPEVESILARHGIAPAAAYDTIQARRDAEAGAAFLVVELPSEQVAKDIAERAILVRRVLELWGSGPAIQDAVAAVRAFPEQHMTPHFGESTSWAISVEGLRCKLSAAEQEAVRANFKFLPILGPVQLKSPDTTMWCLLDYTAETRKLEGRLPAHAYFGREVGSSNRALVGERSLSKRVYLGPTSMDNEVSKSMKRCYPAKYKHEDAVHMLVISTLW